MNIPNALRYLFPNASPLRDYEVRDGESGAYIAAWNLQVPQPTPVELQTASDAYDVAKAQTDADTAALRTRVRTLAQSAVGVQIDALSGLQVRALLVILLRKDDAIDRAGAIRPLAEWVRD